MHTLGQLLFVAFLIWIFFSAHKHAEEEKFDRERNPSKWKKIDAEKRRNELAKLERKYAEAVKKVPPSQWILMDKYDKADVLRNRESLKEKIDNLKSLIKQNE